MAYVVLFSARYWNPLYIAGVQSVGPSSLHELDTEIVAL